MQDKSPLKYTIVRQMACLDPRNMFSDPYVPGKNETTCSVFRFLQDNQLSGGVSAGTYVFRSLAECTLSLYTVKLVQSQHNTILIVVWFSKCFHDIDWLFLCVIYFVFICFMTGDVIVQHFGNVFSLEAKAESFSSFQPMRTRLDVFLHEISSVNPTLSSGLFCRELLLLSHGQAMVERGFSVNKEVEADMQEDTIVAQSMLCLGLCRGSDEEAPGSCSFSNVSVSATSRPGKEKEGGQCTERKKCCQRRTTLRISKRRWWHWMK